MIHFDDNPLPNELIPRTMTVSELNYFVRDFLAHHFPRVSVTGEISNLSCPRSGHIYFSLKDAGAQIRCAFFRHKQSASQKLADGDEVSVTASVSLYPNRGDYQLIVEKVMPLGEGRLQQQFAVLKQKLQQAGYFDEAHKKPLPAFVKTLGIITSQTGAALQDCLSVIARRAPVTNVVIYHSDVQGDKAPKSLISALFCANQAKLCEVLLLTRGGGSMEDLWAFNDEALAKAIFHSTIPVVSGVGHEVDFTIADFVADKRAPTPSAAAELVTIDQQAWLDKVNAIEKRLCQAIKHVLLKKYQALSDLKENLQDPAKKLSLQAQHVDNLELRLISAISEYLKDLNYRLLLMHRRLFGINLQQMIAYYHADTKRHYERLYHAVNHQLTLKNNPLQQKVAHLNSLNPLNVLSRGFSVVKDESNHVVQSVDALTIGQQIELVLHKGKAKCEVKTLFETSDTN